MGLLLLFFAPFLRPLTNRSRMRQGAANKLWGFRRTVLSILRNSLRQKTHNREKKNKVRPWQYVGGRSALGAVVRGAVD